MKGDDWTGIEECPIEAGIDPEATILVWHIYQGVMTIPCGKYGSNPLFTHWRRPDARGWIRREERLPEERDSDAQHCVIARDAWGDITMAGWHRFAGDGDFTHWQHPPGPPLRIANQETGRQL